MPLCDCNLWAKLVNLFYKVREVFITDNDNYIK